MHWRTHKTIPSLCLLAFTCKQTKHTNVKLKKKLKKMNFAPKALWSLHYQKVCRFSLVILSFIFLSITLNFHLHNPIPIFEKKVAMSTSQCLVQERQQAKPSRLIVQYCKPNPSTICFNKNINSIFWNNINYIEKMFNWLWWLTSSKSNWTSLETRVQF